MKEAFDSFHKTVERSPLENEGERFLLSHMADANGIDVSYCDREEWEKQGGMQSALETNENRTHMRIPTDLHLWEILPFVEQLATEVLKKDPAEIAKQKEALDRFAHLLKNAGKYVASYIDEEDTGYEMGKNFSDGLQKYGSKITEALGGSHASDEEEVLRPEDKQEVDRWLAGEASYVKRLQKIEAESGGDALRKEVLLEQMRAKAVKQFFRIAEKHLTALREKSPEMAPGRVGSDMLNRASEQLNREIKKPMEEMYKALVQHGVEELARRVEEIPFPAAFGTFRAELEEGTDASAESIVQALRLPERKASMQEMKMSGDIEGVSRMELQIIADIESRVQDALGPKDFSNKERIRQIRDELKSASEAPESERAERQVRASTGVYDIVRGFDRGVLTKGYSFDTYPKTAIEDGAINCVIASMLGGRLMKESGVKYLVGDVPGHTFLVFVTADNKVYYHDMLRRSEKPREITATRLYGREMELSPEEAMAEIRKLASGERQEGVKIAHKDSADMPDVPLRYDTPLVVYPPETGHTMHLLTNMGNVLGSRARDEKLPDGERQMYRDASKAAYNYAAHIAPQYAMPERNLVMISYDEGNVKEALAHAMKAMERDPKDPHTYYMAGVLEHTLGHIETALGMYGHALELNSRNVESRFGRADIYIEQGKYEEAEKDLDFLYDFAMAKGRDNVFGEVLKRREKMSPSKQKQGISKKAARKSDTVQGSLKEKKKGLLGTLKSWIAR